MNDSLPGRRRPRPARAEPLQPDRPFKGRKSIDPQASSGHGADGGKPAASDEAAAEQQKKQSRDALANVREGYE